jgi:hypothetical protein
LRAAARRDEHEIALGGALRVADTATTRLLLDLTSRSAAPGPGGDAGSSGVEVGMSAGRPGAEVGGGPDREPADARADSPATITAAAGVAVHKRASGSEVRGVVDELLAEAESRPDAVFDITWRIVAP